MDVKVYFSNFEKFKNNIESISKSQHQASVLALTRTAYKARLEVIKQIQKKFTLTNKFTVNSVRYEGAKFTQREPFSIVTVGAWYMSMHDKGGTQKPFFDWKGKKYYPIKIKGSPIERKRLRSLRDLENKKIGGHKPFTIRKGTKEVVFVRTGAGKSSIMPILILYEKISETSS